jgi:hypothetical protein
MEHEPLHDGIASLLPTHSLRQIARIVHVGLDRVRDEKQAEGRTIQPLISAGKTEVPPEYAEAVRTPTTWNEQLDEILARMVDQRGRR